MRSVVATYKKKFTLKKCMVFFPRLPEVQAAVRLSFVVLVRTHVSTSDGFPHKPSQLTKTLCTETWCTKESPWFRPYKTDLSRAPSMPDSHLAGVCVSRSSLCLHSFFCPWRLAPMSCFSAALAGLGIAMPRKLHGTFGAFMWAPGAGGQGQEKPNKPAGKTKKTVYVYVSVSVQNLTEVGHINFFWALFFLVLGW
jgi:hypothetical protein